MALAIEYRPTNFEEVVGNEATIKSLKAVFTKERKKIQHAFLLTGPAGCGKTTIGRIISNELGCEGMDFMEVDARKAEEIDNIKRTVYFKPLEGVCRVWFLDECHNLSSTAQDTLLKLLEDPPEHAYFILATTDPQKLKPTTISRCAHFEVAALDEEDLLPHLKQVARKERKRVPDEVLEQICKDSLGSVRGALQILDKIIDLPKEEMAEAAEQVAAKENEVIELCRALMQRQDWKTVTTILKGLQKEDPERMRLAVLGYCSSILMNPKGNANIDQAFVVMDCFREPLWNNGRAGLVMYCYEARESK